MKKGILVFLSLLMPFVTAYSGVPSYSGLDSRSIESLAIQDRGRIKPFDTFASEAVQYITGKKTYAGQKPAITMLSWLLNFETSWQEEPFILVDSPALRTAVNLPTQRRHFSPQEIASNAALTDLVKAVGSKQRRGDALNEIEKGVQTLQNRRAFLEAISSGRAWNILPNQNGVQAQWFSLADFSEGNASSHYSQENLKTLADLLAAFMQAFEADRAEDFKVSTGKLVSFIKNDLGQDKYPTEASMNREILYNHFRPFRWAWVFYLAAFCLLTAGIISQKSLFHRIGGFVLIGGWAIHTFGFALRCFISGRPPVTNMYESVIWVSWGCIVFGMIIWALYKNALIPAASTVFAIAALVLADNVPAVLDPSIHPLEPVLRSNFWLTIHVLTITLSYAAFALSLCLGNVVLGTYLLWPRDVGKVQVHMLYMYRAMQIGVILLAAGTILGGVWADYSWGRFWGWDPKEVWALVALLLYLAVLHGRFSGWLKGFGFTAGTVLSFLGVLMAWYGVNFVLGAGLHSYGFGSGGGMYVFAFVLAQLALIAAAYYRSRHA